MKKSISTRRLAGALLAVAVAGSSAFLLPARAAPGPPASTAPPAAAAPPASLPDVTRTATPQPGLPAAPAAAPTPAVPSSVLRFSRNIAGDAKPLLLSADEFVSWIEKGHRVILMKGQVLIQQGVIRLRCREAAAFVNLDRLQRQGILHAAIYAEQDVTVEDGKSEKKGIQACIDLNTRGELKILAHKNRVLQSPVNNATIFLHALKELYGLDTVRQPRPAGVEEPADRRQPTGPIAPTPPPTYVPSPPGAPTPPGPPAALAPPSSIRGVAPETPPLNAPAAPALPEGSAGRPPASTPNNPPARPTQRPAPPAFPGTPGTRGLSQPQGVDAPLRQYTVAPRTGATFQLKSDQLPSGEQASIFTGGVIINVRGSDGSEMLDIESDNALIWSRGGMSREVMENLRRPEGQTSRDLEFYFSGNAQVRQKTADGMSLLQADEIYLDARRNVAIALSADLQISRPTPESKNPGRRNEDVIVGTRQPDPYLNTQPVHLRADELRQLAAGKYQALRAEVFSSKLPSDPGLKIHFSQATLEEVRVPKTTLRGRPIVDRNGKPIDELQRPIVGDNARVTLEGVPIFYLPRFRTDASDPMGPLEAIRTGYNRIYGFSTGVTLDVYDLFHLQPIPDSRWRMDLDYMSKRGTALGSTFDATGLTYFEMPAKATYFVRGYGMYDKGSDILGGGRGELTNHPDWRGRFLFRQNIQELPEGFALQSQLSGLSDRNFLEQYYKYEFDTDVNQNTYLYVKQTQGSLAWTGLVEPRLRNWVNETEWLPRVDGYLLGHSFFDRLTYSAHASAGFARLLTSNDTLAETGSQLVGPLNNPLPPVSITDVETSTGRFDLLQELSVPFYAGPVKLAPYMVGDLAYYTQDLNGDGSGRAWGGLGLRASMPLSRLYPDVCSDLFNLNGINHKAVLSANYLWAASTTHFRTLPQLDRLNDDPTDQALRDLRPLQRQGIVNPVYGPFLATSALFDPQVYAVRRLVENRIDTLDDINVVQLDLRQRLQTKRGFPGNQHIVDWMTLDLSASAFPTKSRDNFGSTFAFLEYDYTWNIGDRTSLVSSGWIDPIDNGARVFTVGSFFDRPDRTQFYLGYRQIDPVQSKAVTGSVTYVFSPKYAMTGSTTYDFGTQQSLSNSLLFTRLGADINVSLGFTYNALQNNFGFQFEVMPNLIAGRSRPGVGVNNSSLTGR